MILMSEVKQTSKIMFFDLGMFEHICNVEKTVKKLKSLGYVTAVATDGPEEARFYEEHFGDFGLGILHVRFNRGEPRDYKNLNGVSIDRAILCSGDFARRSYAESVEIPAVFFNGNDFYRKSMNAPLRLPDIISDLESQWAAAPTVPKVDGPTPKAAERSP